MEEKVKDLWNLYSIYLLTETQFPSCVRFSESTNGEVSHDKINRFLENNKNWWKELFEEIKEYLDLEWGILHIDDSVTDKVYSWLWKSDLTDRYYSWKHHKIIQWISIITLFYTDKKWVKLPVNYRIIDKTSWKTKNELFLEMLEEALIWWLKPSMVTWDSWYSSAENLNFLIKKGIDFLFWLKSNRLICKKWEKWKFQQVSQADLKSNWEIVYLKWVAFVKVFEKDNNYYAYYNWKAKDKKDDSNLDTFTESDFKNTKKQHWDIENYHRCIKQICNIEGHRFRNKWAIKGHFFYSLKAFCILEVNRFLGVFKNWYSFIFDNTRSIIKTAFSNLSLDNLVISWI